MPDTVIKIEHLSKMYRLGVINNGTLWQDIQTYLALKLKKEDPHSKIGEDKYSGDIDHFWALKDVSIEIKQGDRVGIIGKNGAGKSTLLKLLSRITSPTEGIIKIKGKTTSLLEVGTGFHGELTGRENIFLNGAILGMKKRRIDEKLDSIIEFSGIEHHIDTPVKRYSSGMYVRLAFAVAAHLDSDILIADEVLAVGDAEFQKKALGKMQELSTGEGRTVLFVSHNMASVKKLCNCGIVLDKGDIILRNDNVEELINNYLFNTEKFINTVKWINNGELSNSCFKPLIIELLNENGEIINMPISNKKKYILNLSFEIKETTGGRLHAFICILDENRYPLFYSEDLFKDHKPIVGFGKVSFDIIPPLLQGKKKYILSLHVQLSNQWIINPFDDIITIGITILEDFSSPIKHVWQVDSDIK